MLSDSQSFRIQLDDPNMDLSEFENQIFNTELGSPSDSFELWNVEDKKIESSPKSTEEEQNELKEYQNFLFEESNNSPFSTEESYGSPFDNFFNNELGFEAKMFEDIQNGNDNMIQEQHQQKMAKIETLRTPGELKNQKIGFKFENNQTGNQNNFPLNVEMNPFNQELIMPVKSNFNNNMINNNNFVNNYNKINTNNTIPQIKLNSQLNTPIKLNNNIPNIPFNPPNTPPKSNFANGSGVGEGEKKTKKTETNKKRKRIVNNTNPTNKINNSSALIENSMKTPTPSSSSTPNTPSRYLLTEEKIQTTTSEEIEMYIDHLTKKNLISKEELKELKKQRRRIKNREYAKNKRVINKDKVGDLKSRVEQLEKENKLLKEHLHYVLNQFEVFKQQVAISNSGNNKIDFVPPNLPINPSANKANHSAFGNKKSNALFVFVLLFSFGIYFNLFAGLSVFSLNFNGRSSSTGSSRIMLSSPDKYYPPLSWIVSSYNLIVNLKQISPYNSLYSPPSFFGGDPSFPSRVSLLFAGYSTRNETHLISYLAFEDPTDCFYLIRAKWDYSQNAKEKKKN